MAKVFQDIVDYIENNLTNDIEYKKLSEIANCSEYTLLKVFPIVCNITIADYIRRRRLTEAGKKLLNSNNTILDIAVEYKYNSPDSFTRAFKAFHGILPSQVKIYKSKLLMYLPMQIEVKHSSHKSLQMRIVKKDEFYLFGVSRHYSSVDEGLREIGNFWKQMDSSIIELIKIDNQEFGGLIGFVAKSINGNGIDYTICASCNKNKYRIKGFKLITINPSSWIVFHADTDNSEDIQSLTYKIYNEYLPQSEYKINDKYEIELYTSNGIYLSEIWIPLL